MKLFKNIFFAIVFFGAGITAVALLYSQQVQGTSSQPASVLNAITSLRTSASSSVSSSPELLGISTEDSLTKDVSSLVDYPQAAEHLALTIENIIWFTNQERTTRGLRPLRAHGLLAQSSREKNNDMITYHYFDHSRTLPNGTTQGFDQLIDHEGYLFIKIGENLAKGTFASSSEVVTTWMNSPYHKKNILDPLYEEIGVSITEGYDRGSRVFFITQHFGRPRSSCPQTDTVLKKRIDNITAQAGKIKGVMQTLATQGRLDLYEAQAKDYNRIVLELNDLVDKYNQQVSRADACVHRRE